MSIFALAISVKNVLKTFISEKKALIIRIFNDLIRKAFLVTIILNLEWIVK